MSYFLIVFLSDLNPFVNSLFFLIVIKYFIPSPQLTTPKVLVLWKDTLLLAKKASASTPVAKSKLFAYHLRGRNLLSLQMAGK